MTIATKHNPKPSVYSQSASKRWADHRDLKEHFQAAWDTLPLDEAQSLLAQLLEEYQRGARIVSARNGTGTAKSFVCQQCGTETAAKPAAIYTRREPSGVFTNHFICSPRCNVLYQTKHRGGIVK